jgi:hypothetical protein
MGESSVVGEEDGDTGRRSDWSTEESAGVWRSPVLSALLGTGMRTAGDGKSLAGTIDGGGVVIVSWCCAVALTPATCCEVTGI